MPATSRLATAAALALFAIASTSARAQVLDPTTLHVYPNASGCTQCDPNIIPGNQFSIAHTSQSANDDIISPPGVFVFIGVPNGSGVPTLGSASDPSGVMFDGGANVPTANVTSIFDITNWMPSNTNDSVLGDLLQTSAITTKLETDFTNFTSAMGTAFDGASLDNSLHFASLTGADATLISPPILSVTNYEIYGFEVQEPLNSGQILDFVGSFPNGSFVVPVGFTQGFPPNGEAVTTSFTNVGIVSTQNRVTPAPEPSTWVLFLTGFGVLAYVASRRRARELAV
jgi:hypothetical protein